MAALATRSEDGGSGEDCQQETKASADGTVSGGASDEAEIRRIRDGEDAETSGGRCTAADDSGKNGNKVVKSEKLPNVSKATGVERENRVDNPTTDFIEKASDEEQSEGGIVLSPRIVENNKLSSRDIESMNQESIFERKNHEDNENEADTENISSERQVPIMENNSCVLIDMKENVSNNADIVKTPQEHKINAVNSTVATEHNVLKKSGIKMNDMNSGDSAHLVARRTHAKRKSEISLTISENYRKYSQVNIVSQKIAMVPPNGGYGWVIVGAVSFILMLIPSLQMCYGLVYADVQRDGGHSNAEMVGVATVVFALRHLLSPASSLLSETWGPRPVTVMGLLLLSLSVLLSAFTYTNVAAFYIFYGVLQGIGYSMVYPQLTLITQRYFSSKRVTALALSYTGLPVGNILMPPLVYHLIQAYTVRGAFLIWSGILLNSVAAALLFHPVKWHLKKELSIVYDHQPTTASPTGEFEFQFRRQVANKHIASSLIDDEALARSCSFSSLTSRNSRTDIAGRQRELRKSKRPTGIKEEDYDSQSSASLCPSSERTTTVQHITPNTGAFSDQNRSKLKSAAAKEAEYSEIGSCTQSVSSACPTLDTCSVFDSDTCYAKPSTTKRVRSVSENEAPHSPIKFRISMPDSEEENQAADEKDKLSIGLLSPEGSKFNSTKLPHSPKLEDSQTPNTRPLVKWTEGIKDLMLSYKEILSHKVFILTCLSGTCGRLVFTNYTTFLPLRGKELDPTSNVVWLLSTVAITDMAVKFLAAAVAAKFKIRTRYMYICGTLLTALACLTAALTRHMTALYVSCVMSGAGSAVQVSTFSVLLLEAIGANLMVRGLGLQYFVVGVIALLIMPINGVLLDVTGSCRVLYLVLFGCSLTSLLLWSVGYPLIRRYDKRHDDKLNVGFPE